MSVNDNKFARQSAASVRGGRDQPPGVDEHLTRLEEDMRRLKVEYDIYFASKGRRAPFDMKSRVETAIKRLGDDRTFTFAQRYRYNSLVARYTSFKEMWRRTIQDREEGRDAASLARSERGATVSAPQRPDATFACADAHTDTATVQALYDALIDAKQRCGEVTDDMSFARFHRMIAKQTDALKERLSCDSVRFSITTDDGRVSFKARADK